LAGRRPAPHTPGMDVTPEETPARGAWPARPPRLDLSGEREAIDYQRRLAAGVDHAGLWNVCLTRPTDFEPYGHRVREDADCSCGCRYFVPLAEPFGADWGVCANPLSPRAGLLTFEHQGCPFFAASPEPTGYTS
jgi:hypothetical protein